AQEVRYLRRAQQGLGRYATPIQADSAEMLALDECRLEPELSGANGRYIAAWTAPDDHEIEGLLGHDLRSFRLWVASGQAVGEVIAVDDIGELGTPMLSGACQFPRQPGAFGSGHRSAFTGAR